jgi:hypothetical protein
VATEVPAKKLLMVIDRNEYTFRMVDSHLFNRSRFIAADYFAKR